MDSPTDIGPIVNDSAITMSSCGEQQRDRSLTPKREQPEPDEQVQMTAPVVGESLHRGGIPAQRGLDVEPEPQIWHFTDIVNGPYADLTDGPMKDLPTVGGPVQIQIGPMTSAFHLRKTLEEIQPDLIVSFGSWPNVLTSDICEKLTSSDCCRPHDKDRQNVQHRQKKIFDDPPEFLIAFSSAIAAQAATSYMTIGPKHYLWRTTVKTSRPLQRFAVSGPYDDFYQGYREFAPEDDFIAMYMPGSAEKLAEIDPSGKVELLSVFRKFQTILVLSTGRGVFWSQIVRGMIDLSMNERLVFDKSDPTWAIVHRDAHIDKYNALFECDNINCTQMQKCMRCLRKIKNWSGIPDRQWSTWKRTENKASGPDGSDEAISEPHAPFCFVM